MVQGDDSAVKGRGWENSATFEGDSYATERIGGWPQHGVEATTMPMPPMEDTLSPPTGSSTNNKVADNKANDNWVADI